MMMIRRRIRIETKSVRRLAKLKPKEGNNTKSEELWKTKNIRKTAFRLEYHYT